MVWIPGTSRKEKFAAKWCGGLARRPGQWLERLDVRSRGLARFLRRSLVMQASDRYVPIDVGPSRGMAPAFGRSSWNVRAVSPGLAAYPALPVTSEVERGIGGGPFALAASLARGALAHLTHIVTISYTFVRRVSGSSPETRPCDVAS